MKTPLIILLFLFQVLIASAMTDSLKTVDSSSASNIKNPMNILYIDGFYTRFSGYINFNYEKLITKVISLRFGYGLNYISEFEVGKAISEVIISLINFSFGKSKSKIEIGLGFSFKINENINIDKSSTGVAFSLNYRLMPEVRGLFFRMGFSIIGEVIGPNISLGYAF